MTLLAASGLRKAFGGVQAVKGVSLTVAAGEMVALIGPNGAGKSTCFGLLGGQLRPDAGRVRLDGTDIAGLPPRRLARMGVARTFQTPAVFASMTVRENVQTALIARHRQVWRFGRPAARLHPQDADRLLARVALGTEAERGAGLLSHGDLKRLELAVALAGAPRLLLLDEPTAGTALGERAALMRLVRALATEERIAVLFTEHDMEAVFGHADRVLVLDRGSLIAAGDPETVRRDARVRAVYLGAC